MKRMKAARLVVLGVAVAAGGLAALLAAGSGDKTPAPPPPPQAKLDTVDVLVARSDITLGQVVNAQMLQWQAWPSATVSPHFITRTDKPNALEDLAGSVARAPFFAGEPVREAKLVRGKGSGYMAAILPSGMRAISTDITPETGAGGFILPGDHVDVILSRRDTQAEKAGGGAGHVSETILSNVRVLAIDQTVDEKNGQKVVVGKTATLELAPAQAETLAVSRQLGTLSLALRSIVDANASADEGPEETRSRGGAVNVVRFGVTTTATSR